LKWHLYVKSRLSFTQSVQQKSAKILIARPAFAQQSNRITLLLIFQEATIQQHPNSINVFSSL